MLLLQHRGEPKAGWLRFTLVVGLVPNIDRKLNFEGFVPIGAVSRIVESTYLDLEIPRNFDFSHWF
jgi:hypothetical protein